MKNRCEYCGSQIRYQYVKKKNSRYTISCEHCHETLKSTPLSNFLFAAFFIIPLAIMQLGIENVGLKIPVVISWITISIWLIHPFFLRYEKPFIQ